MTFTCYEKSVNLTEIVIYTNLWYTEDLRNMKITSKYLGQIHSASADLRLNVVVEMSEWLDPKVYKSLCFSNLTVKEISVVTQFVSILVFYSCVDYYLTMKAQLPLILIQTIQRSQRNDVKNIPHLHFAKDAFL